MGRPPRPTGGRRLSAHIVVGPVSSAQRRWTGALAIEGTGPCGRRPAPPLSEMCRTQVNRGPCSRVEPQL
jgi:hypothetical protein